MSTDTYPAGMPIEGCRVLHQLRAWLPLIGRADLVQQLHCEQWGGDPEWGIEIGDTGIAVDCCHRYTPPGIVQRPVDGMRVFTWEGSGGTRTTPPEQWDRTQVETQHIDVVLITVAALLAREALHRMPPLPPDLAYPQPAEEQVE